MPSFRLAAISLSELTPRVPYTRGVLHHARPARKPAFPSPLDPVQPKPTAGTSTPRANPSSSSSSSSSSSFASPSSIYQKASTRLEDSGLEFHHAPPPSAPTYTTGTIPDVLRWAQGSSDVRRSAQAGAPLVRQKKTVGNGSHDLGLSQEAVQEIARLRLEDPIKWSRKALCQKFDIPQTQSYLLARLAPTPESHRTRLAEELKAKKNRWGFNKSVSREARQLRKGLW